MNFTLQEIMNKIYLDLTAKSNFRDSPRPDGEIVSFTMSQYYATTDILTKEVEALTKRFNDPFIASMVEKVQHLTFVRWVTMVGGIDAKKALTYEVLIGNIAGVRAYHGDLKRWDKTLRLSVVATYEQAIHDGTDRPEFYVV